MPIQFTQYILPNGQRQKVLFHRSENIEELSRLIISQGGYFDVEILRTGETSLTAEIKVHDEVTVLAHEIVNTVILFKNKTTNLGDSQTITGEALKILNEAVDTLVKNAYIALTDHLGLPRTKILD